MEALAFAGLLGAGYVASRNGQKRPEGFVGTTGAPRGVSDGMPRPSGPAYPGPPTSEMERQFLGVTGEAPIIDTSAPLARGSALRMNQPGVEVPPVYNTESFVSPLSGLTFGPGEFKHKNMQPFIRGGPRQNMRDGTNSAVLGTFTGGASEERQSKREQAPMFDTAKPYGTPHGAPSTTTFEHDRIVGSTNRSGERPFEQIRVGPGLGMGYTAEGTGGFQQAYAEEVARSGYKDINELRPGNKQKIENDQLPYTPAKATVSRRGVVGTVNKQRPDRVVYNEGGEHNGGAFASVVRAANRAVQVLLGTTRPETTTDYTGTAGPADSHATYTTGSYRAPHTIQHGALPFTAADASREGFKNSDAECADYGRAGIDIPENERDVTGTRTHTTGVVYGVKARTAPLAAPRATLKEEYVDNPQEAGYFGRAGPTASCVYDPNDIARTTIKETNVHNTHTGNVRRDAPARGQVYDPADIARRTIKETTVNEVRTGHMRTATYKTQVWDADDVTRTTSRQTLDSEDTTVGMAASTYKGQAWDPDDITRTTGRETLDPEDTTTGMAATTYKGQAYDPSDTTRTTVRETTEDDGRVGIAVGAKRTKVYDPDDVAKRTLRNTMSDVDPWLNTAPAGAGATARARYVDGVRATQKAQLSNNEYTGTAGSDIPAARSQQAEREMRTNPTKEKVARGRTPTRTGVKLVAGKDRIRAATPRRPARDDVDNRVPTQTRVAVAPRADIGRVRVRTVEQVDNRNTADMLSALASNPFAARPLGR